MKIAIAGKKNDTYNYVNYVHSIGAEALVTLNIGEVASCDALILPGGGDITPAFFGEQNHGSHHIDTELDILQLQALDLCIRSRKPVLGICKGMQLINISFGGTIVQDLPTSYLHKYNDGDSYHVTATMKHCWLSSICDDTALVNSAHHQAIGKIGTDILVDQYCPLDQCIEAISHRNLPIIGVQWHPERLDTYRSKLSGELILLYLVSLIPLSPQ